MHIQKYTYTWTPKQLNDFLYFRLLGLAVDCDEGSEQIAENFLNTQISIEEFISKWVKVTFSNTWANSIHSQLNITENKW